MVGIHTRTRKRCGKSQYNITTSSRFLGSLSDGGHPVPGSHHIESPVYARPGQASREELSRVSLDGKFQFVPLVESGSLGPCSLPTLVPRRKGTSADDSLFLFLLLRRLLHVVLLRWPHANLTLMGIKMRSRYSPVTN